MRVGITSVPFEGLEREQGVREQRFPMRKIRDVLRLRAGRMSKRKIAASLSIGVTAARELRSACKVGRLELAAA
jgi:hypothetical protein